MHCCRRRCCRPPQPHGQRPPRATAAPGAARLQAHALCGHTHMHVLVGLYMAVGMCQETPHVRLCGGGSSAEGASQVCWWGASCTARGRRCVPVGHVLLTPTRDMTLCVSAACHGQLCAPVLSDLAARVISSPNPPPSQPAHPRAPLACQRPASYLAHRLLCCPGLERARLRWGGAWPGAGERRRLWPEDRPRLAGREGAHSGPPPAPA